LVSGSLLHLALHRSEPVAHGVERARDRLAAGVGAILAVVLVLAMRETELTLPAVAGELGAEATIIALATLVAPWFAAAAIGSTLLHLVTPIPALAAAQRGPKRLVAEWRKLAESAPTRALAVLVAVPLLGLDALLLSVPLLGDHFALLRMFAAAAIAALVWLALAPRVAPAGDAEAEMSRPGLLEFADHAGPWLLFGLAVVGLVEPFLDPSLLAGTPVWAQILAAAALAAPFYVPAVAALPIAAVLVHKGLSPGAALTFLLVGPVLHRRVLTGLHAVHGLGVLAGFVALVLGGAITAGFVGDRLLPADPLGLHAAAARGLALLEWVGLGATGVLLAISLIRQGPRGYLEQILPIVHEHHHPREHP
jgi:hypothetical protein